MSVPAVIQTGYTIYDTDIDEKRGQLHNKAFCQRHTGLLYMAICAFVGCPGVCLGHCGFGVFPHTD